MDTLNQQQLEVVTHCDGPLLVVAGAGTGKTKTVTKRILYLIKNKNVKPENVLALTFTEAATREMQDRVDAEMDFANGEVTIKTFHSFCDQILRERGHEIGLPTGFTLMDSLGQWLFFKKHLFEFRLSYFRPLGNPNKFIYDLLGYFGRLKDENIGPEKYLEFANSLAAKADLDNLAALEDANKHLELAEVFVDYQRILIENNLMDFADLNYYVLKLLSSRPSVLNEMQERYKYIMVDEFQDTNFAQSELIFLLSAAHKNIVVVGDDDQSIYKWRGASLSNILHFQQTYSEAKTVVLKQNYRSTQNILDTAYHLIQNNNPDRLEVRENINKRLESSLGEGSKVNIVHLRSVDEEVSFTVSKIMEAMNNDSTLQPSDFAILLRNNGLVEPYIQALKKVGLPYYTRNLKSILKSEVGRDIYALFRLLRNFDDDVALYRILNMPCLGLDIEVIQDFVAGAHKNSTSLQDFIKSQTVQTSIDANLQKSSNLLDILYGIRRSCSKKLIGEIIYGFLEAFQIIKFWQENETEENIQNIEDLSSLSRIVAQFDNENIYPNPKDFLEYLETLEEANMKMGNDEAPDNMISISTVHGSKGLEFKYVFVGSLVNERFPARKHGETLEVPIDLTNEVLPEKDYRLEEERRLMYVAVTRAKTELYLTYSDKYDGNKTWKPSRFIQEIRGVNSVIEQEYPKVSVVKYEPAPEINKNEATDNGLKKFSYSQFETFQTCPLKYKFRHVYQLAPPPSHASQFGTSVHETLNEFYSLLKRGQEVSMDLLNELYEKNWRPAGYASKAHQMTRKKKGLEMMEKFYEINSRPSWKVPAFLERSFTLHFGDKLIGGRIDRIDKLEDGTYEVIDYKTGQSKKDAKLESDLQLGVYLLACRQSLKLPVSKLGLYFLDDNVAQTVEAEKIKLEKVSEKLQSLCDEIPFSDFEAKPSPFSCGFCDYSLVCKASAVK